MESLNQSVTKNFFWRFLERSGAQLVEFVVSLILARLLDPETYGLVALISIFTAILCVFIDSGMGTALIQKKDADNLDFSTLFYFNVFISIFLYLIMFFCAPFIADFYGNKILTSLIRVQCLVLLLSGIKNVQCAYVSKNLIFKKFFFSTLAGTILAAIVGILLAYRGAGPWALVIQSVTNTTVDTIILWITVKWRPDFKFSFKRLKSLFSYGWKLLCSALLDTVYNKLRQLIIGKKYSPADLSYYSKGDHFPSFIIRNVSTSIDSVLLPAMSQNQDDNEKIKQMTRKSIQISTYIMMPMMMGLAVCAEPIIRILLGEKWLSCVFYMRVFCFSYAFWPVHTANLNAIKALGRSDLFLILEIIKKIVGLVAVCITMWISVKAMALSIFVTSILSQIINSWPNKKLLNYSYLKQLKDMMPQIMLSIFMGICVYFVSWIPINYWVVLIIQILLGIILYVAGSKLFKVQSFEYILNVLKDLLKSKFNKSSKETELKQDN